MTTPSWHLLGDPLAVRLRHLAPGTRAFGEHLGAVVLMVAEAVVEHNRAQGRRAAAEAPAAPRRKRTRPAATRADQEQDQQPATPAGGGA